MTAITLTPVRSRADRQAFVDLPKRLYRGKVGYLAPLDFDRLPAIDPQKAPFFQHGAAEFWLARRNGVAVGRVSAQVNHLLSTQKGGENIGQFGYLDAENDPDLVALLLEKAENFVRQRGKTAIQGPFSLSINEECGLMIDGFDSFPHMLMPFHPPYLQAAVGRAGYQKAKDLFAYDYDLGALGTQNALKKLRADPRFVLRTVNMADFDTDIARVVDVFNDAWSDNWGFAPFTAAEIAHLAQSLRPIVRKELILLVDYAGETQGMAIATANILEAARGLNGRLFPFGFATLLARLNRKGAVRTCRVPLMGVRKKWRDDIAGAIIARGLIEQLQENAAAAGFVRAELSWVLEDNKSMNMLAKALRAKPYKTYRIFEKSL